MRDVTEGVDATAAAALAAAGYTEIAAAATGLTLAIDPSGRRVIVAYESLETDNRVERLTNAARHPNVADVMTFVDIDERYVNVVFERPSLGSLADALADSGTFAEAQALALTITLAGALRHAESCALAPLAVDLDHVWLRPDGSPLLIPQSTDEHAPAAVALAQLLLALITGVSLRIATQEQLLDAVRAALRADLVTSSSLESVEQFANALRNVERSHGYAVTSMPVVNLDSATTSVESATPSRDSSRPLQRIIVITVAAAIAVGVIGVTTSLGGRRDEEKRASTTTPTSTSTTLDPATAFAPTGVRIVADLGTEVNLQWASAMPTPSFVVETRRSDGSVVGSLQRAQSEAAAVISGLDSSERYCFRIGAVFAVGAAPAFASPVCRSS